MQDENTAHELLSARVFFEAIVPRVIALRAEHGVLPQTTVEFQVVGEDGGVWTLELRGNEGRVVEEGSFTELAARPEGRFRRMCELQKVAA